MAERVVAFLANGVPGNAEDARIYAAMYGQPAAALASMTGVRSGYDLGVRATSPNTLAVVVGAGMGVIEPGTQAQAQYEVASDSDKTVPLTAADGTYDRIDIIVFRVRDTENGASDTDPLANTGNIEPITGIPAPSPVPPQLPTDSYCLQLGYVRVRRNATTVTSADITDVRSFTAANGGIQIVRTLPTTSLWNGRHVFLLSDQNVYKIVNGVWDLVSPTSAPRGRVAIGYNHVNAPAQSTIDNTPRGKILQQVNFTVKPGRLYEIISYCPLTSTASGDFLVFRHFLNQETAPRKEQGALSVPAVAGIQSWHMWVRTFIENPSLAAGNAVAYLTAQRASGSGTHQLVGSDTSGAYLEIRDQGSL
jgi:hypothetical protein